MKERERENRKEEYFLLNLWHLENNFSTASIKQISDDLSKPQQNCTNDVKQMQNFIGPLNILQICLLFLTPSLCSIAQK